MGSSVGGALGNVVGQQDAGQIVGGVAGGSYLLSVCRRYLFRFFSFLFGVDICFVVLFILILQVLSLVPLQGQMWATMLATD